MSFSESYGRKRTGTVIALLMTQALVALTAVSGTALADCDNYGNIIFAGTYDCKGRTAVQHCQTEGAGSGAGAAAGVDVNSYGGGPEESGAYSTAGTRCNQTQSENNEGECEEESNNGNEPEECEEDEKDKKPKSGSGSGSTRGLPRWKNGQPLLPDVE